MPAVAGSDVDGTAALTPVLGSPVSERSGVSDLTIAPARTLVDIFSYAVMRWPQRPALDAPDGQFSYLELRQVAGELAARLHRLGIGAGQRVAVRIPSGTSELYIGILGVLLSGAAYVPIDVDDPEERCALILSESHAVAVVGAGLRVEVLGDRVAGVSEPDGSVSVDAVAKHGGWEEHPLPPPAPADEAWVIFTSGSTGKPKGVAVTHRSAGSFVDAEAQLWTVAPTDRVLAGLSVGFDASCEEIWLAWRHGAALVPAPRQTVRAGEELGRWLTERGVTVVSTVPTLAAMWDESCLHQVRLLILGGEACPEGLGWRLAAGREVWNTYGPTEATVVSTAGRIVPGEPITIGDPLAGWEVAVVEDDVPVLPGEPGELVIGGVGLARYLDPELDSQRYAPLACLRWERAYRTGDIVRQGPTGLEFVGRRDDQVKIGGRRIELGEVEAALTLAPGVRAAAAAVRESAAGNRLLVGYVVPGDESQSAASIRAALSARLPAGLVPLIVFVDELPRSSSGKVDRRALPWPPPESSAGTIEERDAGGALTEPESWLRERWLEQLGPVQVGAGTDFFAVGGTSLAAAKLVSVVRRRFPAVAVADLYLNPTLRGFADRLEQLGQGEATEVVSGPRRRRAFAPWQLLGVLVLLCMAIPDWLFGILAIDRWFGVGPQVAWGVIIVAWLVLSSKPTMALVVVVAKRVLLRELTPGRYPRRGWTATRIVFLEHLAELGRFNGLAGTPWAGRYARLAGHDVAPGARLDTLPPISSLVSIGADATIEGDVDLQGWWVDGDELVVGEMRIGAGARVGTRALLMPGASIGDGAEVEPGTVVDGPIPAGERWAGVPARHVGRAGEHWPAEPPPPAPAAVARRWKLAYVLGFAAESIVGLVSAAPGIALMLLLLPSHFTIWGFVRELIVLAPALVLLFTVAYALSVAAGARLLAPFLKTGLQPALGSTGWAMWMHESLMDAAGGAIFPVFSSSFTRRWLRLCGVPVGPRTEVSITNGLSSLTSIGGMSFAADDVVFVTARSRGGWLFVEPVSVGDRSFLGNSAILPVGSRVGDDSLVGLMTIAPQQSDHGTSWLGAPALELPRRRVCADPRRTTDPPLRLRLARRVMDCIRILLPGTIATVLGALMFGAAAAIVAAANVVVMVLSLPALLFAGGIAAALVTVALKWLLMGRYRPGDHPLFSAYVWRDEIINSCQEQLAGPWLMNASLGTPLMALYLRLMGAKVGRDVFVDNLNTTEFDLAEFGDGCAVNRGAVVETHLFHDRVMSTGPCRIGVGATIGPASVVLPDTVVGDGTTVVARSIVLRGEELPPNTRWHGAPVTPV